MTTNTRLSGVLHMLTNIAVIVAAGCVALVAVQRMRTPGFAPSALPSVYRVGDQVGPIHDVDFHKSAETLLMVVREDCHYCRESLPFYQRLASARAQSRQKARVVVASTDPAIAMSDYLRSSGIEVDQIAQIEPGALKVPGTPTLLLIDSDGKVKRIWRGKLASPQETEVFNVLGLTGPA